MLAGHFAVGLALKSRYDKVPLLALLLAVNLLDWIRLVLLWQGVEPFQLVTSISAGLQPDFHQARYSHALFWSLFYAAGVWIVFVRAEGQRHWAVPLSLGVLSHWLLDAILDAPLPFANFGPDLYLGLGWRNTSPMFAVAIEGAVVCAGWWLYYCKRRGAASRRWPLWLSLVVLLVLLFSSHRLSYLN